MNTEVNGNHAQIDILGFCLNQDCLAIDKFICPSCQFEPLQMQQVIQSKVPTLLETESKCSYIHQSFDGRYILSGESNGTISLWDAQRFEKIQTFQGHTSQVISISLSKDNNNFVSCGRDDEVKLWSIESNRKLCSLAKNSRQRSKVSFTPDGKYIIYVTADKLIKAWSSQTFKPTWSLISCRWNHIMSCSPDGRQIILGDSMRGSVRMWNIQRKKIIRTFNRKSRCSIVSLAYSPNGQYIGFSTAYCSLWPDPELSTQIYLVILDCQTGSRNNLHSPSNTQFEEAMALAFFPESNILISGREDGNIQIWNLKNSKQISIILHPEEVKQLVISSDGKHILSMLNNGILIIETPIIEVDEPQFSLTQ